MALEFIELNIPQEAMQKYIETKLGKPIVIKGYERLGSGWHGTGYKIAYECQGKQTKCILKTLKPEGFSHDYFSDRAGVFILQHNLSNHLPNHIPSIDVGGITGHGELVSLGDCKEFFHIRGIAEGSEYVEDLIRMNKTGPNDKDRHRVMQLSDYLVKLHSSKFKDVSAYNESIARSLYRRHLRDCIGHGEMLMGVLDTYPSGLSWTNDDEFAEIVARAEKYRMKIKNLHHRLVQIHGDFHPGNVYFDQDKMVVLDASREMFGDAADDLTCMGLNYIWYALKGQGNFTGFFKEFFELFWNNYIEKAKDKEINKVAPLFFAFRGVVVAHPLFYPEQKDEIRRKLFNFVKNVLKDTQFSPSKIPEYLG